MTSHSDLSPESFNSRMDSGFSCRGKLWVTYTGKWKTPGPQINRSKGAREADTKANTSPQGYKSSVDCAFLFMDRVGGVWIRSSGTQLIHALDNLDPHVLPAVDITLISKGGTRWCVSSWWDQRLEEFCWIWEQVPTERPTRSRGRKDPPCVAHMTWHSCKNRCIAGIHCSHVNISLGWTIN